MSKSLDCAASSLLCGEITDSCFGDPDCNTTHEVERDQNRNQDSFFNNNGSKSLMGFAIQSEERVKEMVEMEREHLPRDDYLKRFTIGDLDLSFRREALDWIWKAKTHYNFEPLSVCLSVNYLDRFLSVYEFPKGKAWTGQLLAVACLSIAAKMQETKVPLSVDLQVGEPRFVFEAKTIQRMELLVLNTLNWRMQAFTPCCFIDYFLCKINGDHQLLAACSISKSIQLILSIVKGIDFLEFRPSEIAAAVAISVSGEMQAVDIDKAISCLIHVEKGRVFKCVQLIKNLSLISNESTVAAAAAADLASPSASFVPQSPNGVLDAACLSFKSDDTTVGSCANSSHNSPDIKKRKQEVPF